MRFMMLVRADNNSETGILPSKELVSAMTKFNEEMMKAGVMLAGEGLHPSSNGARVSFSGAKPSTTHGPFPANELIAGFWLIQTSSMDEAIDWASRAPFQDGAIEIRPIFETADFPPDILSPDEAAREEEMRDELRRKGGMA